MADNSDTIKNKPTKTRKRTVYTPKGKPVEITATSRISVKLGDNFYTFEAMEKRSIPEEVDVNMDKEWDAIFKELDEIIDFQCEEALEEVRKKRSRK